MSVLRLPASRAEIAETQRVRKRLAVEKAKRSPFWKGKLDHINLDNLEDPAEWRKIPIIDKEMLRALSTEDFYSGFCTAPRSEIAEYWRSGGATGRPLFYPRTWEDIKYGMVGFVRTYQCMECGPGDIAHLSMPLGIHPAGQLWARAAGEVGIGMTWVGAGAAAPSAMQLQLLQSLKPTLWLGMNSYGLHLANLADAQGIDLAAGSVKKILCTAEPMTASKRDKLARSWGAEVFDTFGMTECTMMGAESPAHEGFHVWTDLAFIEVVDPATGNQVAEGEVGTLVVTSLYTNNSTPFLRWNSGDQVIYRSQGSHAGPFSVFPLLRHTNRTTGFFKVRGVNLNHSEFEDFMFRDARVNDFKVEAANDGGNDILRVYIEVKRGHNPNEARDGVAAALRATFELVPEMVVLETGALAKEFENTVKAPRFVDKRG